MKWRRFINGLGRALVFLTLFLGFALLAIRYCEFRMGKRMNQWEGRARNGGMDR